MSGVAFGEISLCHAHQSDSKKKILNGDDDLLTPKEWAAALNRVVGRIELMKRNVYADGNEKRIVPFKTVYDVIQQALSGEDKVQSFCLRILKQLDYGLAECQALVLASTREMARLIAEFMEVLGEHLGVKVCACVGSKRNSIHKNQQSLSSGVHIVVGTPRRVLHLLTRRLLRPDHIKVFVLDEADQLLSCGYKDQIYDIFHLLPSKVQPCLFLATLNPEALEIMRNFVRKPVRILEKRDELEGMKQFYVIVEKEKWKFEILCDIYKTLAMSKSVIFVRSPRYVDWLADKMRSRGLAVSATHEYMDQNERNINVRDFELGSSRVLITTPSLVVSAFYLQKVSAVLNYDLPVDGHLAKWHHGRFGREGVVIDFLTTVDEEERFTDTQIHYNVVVLDLELSSNVL